jgi:GAF domain-containing protein
VATSATGLDMGTAAALRLAVTSARALFRAAACSIAVLDPVDDRLRFVAADGAGEAEIVGRQLSQGVGIAGWVAGSGATLAVADVRRDPRWSAETAAATGYVPAVILAAPLLAPDELLGAEEPLGVIEVLDPDARERDLELLAVIGSLVGATLALTMRAAEPPAADDPLAQAVAAVEALGPAATSLATGLLRALVVDGSWRP